MWSEQFRALARYNSWMNRKLYAASALLSEADRKRDLGAYFKSLEGTLNHLVLTDRMWMARLTGDDAAFRSRDRFGTSIEFTDLAQILYPVFDDLRHNRELLDRQIEFWATQLSNGDLERDLAYFNSVGKRFVHPLWQAAAHFFNHQTHHRGQATTLLYQLGQDPGVTDLIAFLRAERLAKGD